MPLIQWVMQNLQIYRLPAYTASGTIFLYSDKTIASFSENYFARTVKFNIGNTGFDLFGTRWTVIGISAYSNQETFYTAKKNGITKIFRDSEILVNQIPINSLESLQKFLDKPIENLPTYDGITKIFRDNEILVNQIPINSLDSLQKFLDKPIENLLTYEGKRKIRT